MNLDLANPTAVRLEAERRRKLRASGATSFVDTHAAQAMDQRRVEQAVAACAIWPAESPIRAMRWIDGLRCTIAGAPRTKKNGGAGGYMGIKQRPAYRRYRDTIVNGFLPLLAGLELPLADCEYNLAATFYVDKAGEQADLVGLLQGLADALENAGVVSNDRWFRGFDRSRMIAGDPRPRVELLISPLQA